MERGHSNDEVKGIRLSRWQQKSPSHAQQRQGGQIRKSAATWCLRGIGNDEARSGLFKSQSKANEYVGLCNLLQCISGVREYARENPQESHSKW